jgi:phenylacetate-CoA ligase
VPTTDRYPWTTEDVDAYFRRPRAERESDRDARIRRAYERAWDHNRFYRALWDGRGVDRDSVRSAADLRLLPTCDINDMRESIAAEPPYGRHLSMRPDDHIAMINTTGGTTGFPRPIAVGVDDMIGVGDIAARVLNLVGLEPGGVLQVTATYSTHGASWIATWGIGQTRATLLPTSSGSTTSTIRQVEMMQAFGTTVLFSTPTYARVMAETAIDRGIDPRRSSVRTLLIAGEVTTPELRRSLEELWDARVHDLFGTMETLIWSSVDCIESSRQGGALGMHVWDDAVVIEVLDEEGKPCADGEYGDMTVTSWINGLSPKFRYRMGDRVALTHAPCPCGLDTPRMLPVAGRVDDMLRINAQNVWPVNIEELVRRVVPQVGEYVAIAERVGGRDRLRLMVESDDREWSDAMADQLAAEFKAMLAVSVVVEHAPSGATAPLTGAGQLLKVHRIVDQR